MLDGRTAGINKSIPDNSPRWREEEERWTIVFVQVKHKATAGSVIAFIQANLFIAKKAGRMKLLPLVVRLAETSDSMKTAQSCHIRWQMMKYEHPEKYQGERLSHESVCRFVEDKCMKCDCFMGKDHNFEDCRKYTTNRNGDTIKMLDCVNVPDSCKRFQDRAIIQQQLQPDTFGAG